MFKYLSIPILLISISIGILYVYVTKPESSIIYVYPTPDNVNLLQYKDKVNNCYEFNKTEIICPSNDNEIINIPIQN